MDNSMAAVPTLATANQSIFQEVDTKEKPRSAAYVNPRATQWGFIPIATISDVPPNAFKKTTLAGSSFLPMRVMSYPNAQNGETHDRATGYAFTRERMPSDQVADLYTIAGERPVTHFPELATLEDETLQRKVLQTLANPNACTKYPYELGNICSTCWMDHLRSGAAAAIADTFGSDPQLTEIAVATARRLLETLESAVYKARENVNVALREVEDPKTGKDRFYDIDYLNIWHTHQDMPQFRTSTSANSQFDEMTKAFTAALAGRQPDAQVAAGVSIEDVKAIVSEAIGSKDAEIAALKAQLAEMQVKTNETVTLSANNLSETVTDGTAATEQETTNGQTKSKK